MSDLSLDLGLDPIGSLSATGALADLGRRRLLRRDARVPARPGFAGAVLADGRPAHEAGASEAQELAVVLATAVGYLRALERGGHGLEDARSACPSFWSPTPTSS